MDLNLNYAEDLPIVATIDPQVGLAAKTTGDVIDMSELHAVLMVVLMGNIESATIDGGFESSAVVGMTSAATPKAFTQLAASATANDNTQLVLFLRANEIADGHRFVRPYFTPGATLTAGAVGVVVFGIPKYSPGIVTVPDLTTVQEVKK